MEACGTDAAVEVGAMLFTLVDPHVGFEAAYNRWYERDHFYGGCLIGPWLFAGCRWVSPRSHKELRFPSDSVVASPVRSGSFLATYFIHKGHEAEHFAWATAQVHELYGNGRGFDERTHAHTALYFHRRDWYRDEDPVPVHLALDHRYAGLVSIHVDRAEGVSAADYDDWFESIGAPPILAAGSAVSTVCSWRPIIPKLPEGQQAPMDLGSGPGTPARSAQLWFCDADPSSFWADVIAHADAVDDSGIGRVVLAAPFIPTVVGTDRYCDELW